MTAKVFENKMDLDLKDDKEKFIEISVSDTGRGIPKGKEDEIFKRFKRLDADSKGVLSGTGLGLPIAKKIVDMHGGDMWVESVPGKGSKFVFIIPQGRQRWSEKVKYVSQRETKRILIIDDEDVLRELLGRELSKKGYFVTEAGDGLTGLRMATECDYDLVITDIRMPNVNGMDCVRILKRIWPEAFFIIITGFHIEKQLEDMLRNHPYPCVKKPFDLPDLLKIVAKHCPLQIHG